MVHIMRKSYDAGGAMKWRTDAYRNYVLVVLSLITILNYYDRYVISIILQPIKMALHLSDTQAGLLSGVAFALLYTVVGLPIARFADRGNRVKVLGVAMAVWSLMTVACGMASSGAALFAARMGVGLGEAGGPPSIHALVADHFPSDKRARALSWIGATAMLGAILGVSAGGLINDRFGWRAAFWVGGGPGLALALVVFLTIREPVAAAPTRGATTGGRAQVPLKLAISLLSRRSSFVFLIIGLTITSIASFAQAAWLPTLLVRAYALRPGQVGLIYALSSALPSIGGILLGGMIADRWILKDPRILVWILIIANSVSIPTSVVLYLATSLNLALPAAFVGALIGGTALAPTYALVQGLAGSKLRATAAAVYMVCANFIGLCIGPALAGSLSDYLVLLAGADSLRWSLCILLLPLALSLPIFLLATRNLRSDLIDADAPAEIRLPPAASIQPDPKITEREQT